MRSLPENCFCVEERRRQVGECRQVCDKAGVPWMVTRAVGLNVSAPVHNVIDDIAVDLTESAE